MVKFGGDISPLAGKIRELKPMGKDLAAGLAESFKSLAAPFITAGLFEGMQRIGEKVKQIKSDAEVGGVSTDFLQTLNNAGKASGVTAEQVGKLLNKLEQSLPIGSDVETEFDKIADRIAATHDPIEKMNIGVATFGTKLGPVMVHIAGQGSKAIKELGNQFHKFATEDIEAIERANLEIEKTGSTLTVWGGKVITYFARISQAAGIMSANWGMGKFMNPREAGRALVALEEEAKAKEEADKKAAQTAGRTKAAETEREKIQERLAQLNAKLASENRKHWKEEDKHNEDVRKQRLLAAEEVARKERDLRQQFSDRLRFTVGELADLGRSRGGMVTTRGFRSFASRNEQMAMQVQNLEAQAREAYDFGNESRGQFLQSRAESIRQGIGGLTSSERNPYGKMETKLDDMVHVLDTKGIVIREVEDDKT